jgi:hypothetical protein
MSKDEKSFAMIPKELQEKYRKHFGKVGLQFFCDRIDRYYYTDLFGSNFYDEGYVMPCNGETCLTAEELYLYGKGNDLYGLHISNLKIYDKPKELSEFNNLKGEPINRAYQSWGYINE